MATPVQPKLFVEGAASSGIVELFPTVWNAAQNFTSPHAKTRHAALDELLALNAPRLSPLIAYLLATRLIDPDILLRGRIVQSLAAILVPDEQGNPAPEEVRSHLIGHLCRLERTTIFAVLEVAVQDQEKSAAIAALLNLCPAAGNHLADIFGERATPMEVRQRAVDFIGQVGFLEAVSTLERIRNRIESRQNGQKSMPFAPSSGTDESILLPAIKSALDMLQAA